MYARFMPAVNLNGPCQRALKCWWGFWICRVCRPPPSSLHLGGEVIRTTACPAYCILALKHNYTHKHNQAHKHNAETPLKHVKYTNEILHSSPNTKYNTTIMHTTVFHSPHNPTINLCYASTPHHMNEELLQVKNGVGTRKNVQKLKKVSFLQKIAQVICSYEGRKLCNENKCCAQCPW